MYVCVASTARSSMLPFLRLVFIVVRFTSQPFSISYAKNHAMIRRPDPPPPSTNAIFENNCTTPVIHKPIIPNLNLQSLVNIKLRWSHDTIVFRWLCFLSHQTIHVLSTIVWLKMFNLTIQLVSAIQFEIFKSWRLDAHGAYCFSDSAYPIWHTACRIPNTVKY